MLNEYFAILTEAAYHHEGTIFNMAGDSLLVGFNVPFAQPDAALRAWNAAREMVARFAPVSARWAKRTGVATGVGIGICQGDVIIGNVGSPSYASYTIIGNPVNMASRLVQLAAANEVLMCGAYAARLGRELPTERFEERGAVTLRGVSQSIQVFAARLGARPA
jgi:class 3 adenylate cyclase